MPVARRAKGTRAVLRTGSDVAEALVGEADGVLEKGEPSEALQRLLPRG